MECLQDVDINQVVRRVDVCVLQKFLCTVIDSSLNKQCQKCETPLDENLIKLLQMTQLTLEKYRHCQESLGSSFDQLKIKHDAQETHLHQQLLQMQKEKEDLQKEIRQLQEDNAMLKSTTEQRSDPLMMEEKEMERPSEIKTLGPEEQLESGPDESEDGNMEDDCSSLVAKLRMLPPLVIQRRSKVYRPKFIPTLKPIVEEVEEEVDSEEEHDSLKICPPKFVPILEPMVEEEEGSEEEEESDDEEEESEEETGSEYEDTESEDEEEKRKNENPRTGMTPCQKIRLFFKTIFTVKHSGAKKPKKPK